jgi:hypothetical protein
MNDPVSTDATLAGTPVAKARAPSLIAEALRALAERNRAMGLTLKKGNSYVDSIAPIGHN